MVTSLRALIRSILLETVKDNHGVFVSSLADVTWTPEKARIPFRVNPFVGGSPAFAAWLNDGETTRRFRRVGGVAAPGGPAAPRQMSGDEVRDMLGLRRLREGDIPPSGMGARVRRLGRTGTLKGEMVSLNVLLRGLYIDALDAHESGDRETYQQIMGQIVALEQQLADLQTQHDAAETDT